VHVDRAFRAFLFLIATLAVVLAAATAARAGDNEGLDDTRAQSPAAKKAAADAGLDAADPDAAAVAPRTWDLGVFGFVRAGYDAVQRDPKVDFIGRNNGFLLESARVGVEGAHNPTQTRFRVSVEGASDVQDGINTPTGTLQVRLRDAFVRWDPVPFFGLQVGQFRAPFTAEELRSNVDLLLASRAVAQEGVPGGRGYQEPGMTLGRQLGVMVGPRYPFPIAGDFGLAYYAMIMNGNGQNQLVDDNGKLGLVGRLEAVYGPYVTLGGAAFKNDRTVGTLPNLYEEADVGFAGDLLIRWTGLEIFGQVATIRTEYPTVGTRARNQLGYHAQIGYRIDELYVPFTPTYRYAHYHPWSGSAAFDSYKLDYHTFGVRIFHPTLPISGYVNYTVTIEPAARRLDNDRFELLGQVAF
jgi:hypothetical protein